MEEVFMIKQLMIQLNNTMKSEKYQQDKVMITQGDDYWLFIGFQKKKKKMQISC